MKPLERIFLAALLTLAPIARAQLSERPGDPLGLSIREPAIRVIHSDRPEPPGSSLHLQLTDPWLAYQMGHSLFHREWTAGEGLLETLRQRPVAGAANSCGMCHNLPYRSAGAGGNAAEPFGHGRNTSHLFGAGLMEMLGAEIRRQILASHDDNGNGWLDHPAETQGRRAVVEAASGIRVDFGALDDGDGDGQPDLNPAVIVLMRTPNGRLKRHRLLVPSQLGDPDIAGYDIAVAPFAAERSDHQFPTLRLFAAGVLQTIMGFRVADPTIANDEGERRDPAAYDGWGETSNAGARQLAFPMKSPVSDISEGQMDLLEWFMLNHPTPATGRQTAETRRGRALMDQFGCTACHVADWTLPPRDEAAGQPGDRRFFHLETAYDPERGELVGALRDLTRTKPGPKGELLRLPKGEGFAVRGIFTDFRHHDLGPRFHEHRVEGDDLMTTTHFRTPPLWGVGSSAPYGYDGRSPTLRHVILRHGGEAAGAAAAFSAASLADQNALLAFLNSLVLFSPHDLPVDLDGDGRIEADYAVAGSPAGPERFRPELLFRRPPEYAGLVKSPDGELFFSYALQNLEEAYGLGLPALRDRNGDLRPDLLEKPAASARGWGNWLPAVLLAALIAALVLGKPWRRHAPN